MKKTKTIILIFIIFLIFFSAYYFGTKSDLIITDYQWIDLPDCQRKDSLDNICGGDERELQLTIKNIGPGFAFLKNLWVSTDSGRGGIIYKSEKNILLPNKTAIINKKIFNINLPEKFTVTINNENRAKQTKEINYQNNSIMVNKPK